MADFIEKRAAWRESRRASDCFPDGGSVALTIAVFSAISFLVGVFVGAIVW
jgi:hypothetical protein